MHAAQVHLGGGRLLVTTNLINLALKWWGILQRELGTRGRPSGGPGACHLYLSSSLFLIHLSGKGRAVLSVPASLACVSLFVSIETRVQIQESVRGKDVFVIQTVSKYGNWSNSLILLLLPWWIICIQPLLVLSVHTISLSFCSSLLSLSLALGLKQSGRHY